MMCLCHGNKPECRGRRTISWVRRMWRQSLFVLLQTFFLLSYFEDTTKKSVDLSVEGMTRRASAQELQAHSLASLALCCWRKRTGEQEGWRWASSVVVWRLRSIYQFNFPSLPSSDSDSTASVLDGWPVMQTSRRHDSPSCICIYPQGIKACEERTDRTVKRKVNPLLE